MSSGPYSGGASRLEQRRGDAEKIRQGSGRLGRARRDGLQGQGHPAASIAGADRSGPSLRPDGDWASRFRVLATLSIRVTRSAWASIASSISWAATPSAVTSPPMRRSRASTSTRPEVEAISQLYLKRNVYYDATVSAYGYWYDQKDARIYTQWVDEMSFLTPHAREIVKARLPRTADRAVPPDLRREVQGAEALLRCGRRAADHERDRSSELGRISSRGSAPTGNCRPSSSPDCRPPRRSRRRRSTPPTRCAWPISSGPSSRPNSRT